MSDLLIIRMRHPRSFSRPPKLTNSNCQCSEINVIIFLIISSLASTSRFDHCQGVSTRKLSRPNRVLPLPRKLVSHPSSGENCQRRRRLPPSDSCIHNRYQYHLKPKRLHALLKLCDQTIILPFPSVPPANIQQEYPYPHDEVRRCSPARWKQEARLWTGELFT